MKHMESEITPMYNFSGDDIDQLYRDITRTIIRDGKDIVFGHEKKKAREIHATVQIYGMGIKRLMYGSVPRKFPFQGDKLKEFRKLAIADDVNPYGNDYTYQELVRKFPTNINQLNQMGLIVKDRQSTGMTDNGIVGVLYHPNMWKWENKPCWNWLQLRYLGNNEYSLRLLFRSHDYGMAMWANMSFILYMINYFVMKPNECNITEIILTSTSAHIYENDQDSAVDVGGIHWSREEDKSLLHQSLFVLRAIYDYVKGQN